MQQNLSKIDWANSLKLPVQLDSIFASTDLNSRYLISIALAHSSYIFENCSGDLAKNVKMTNDCLYNIGFSISNMFLSWASLKENINLDQKHLNNNAIEIVQIIKDNFLNKIEAESVCLLSRSLASSDTLLSNVKTQLTFQIIGAIYISKGLARTMEFLSDLFSIKSLLESTNSDTLDSKSILQDIVQKKYNIQPIYELIDSSGPAHDKEFLVEVSVKKRKTAARGKSKKKAEIKAAHGYLYKYESYELANYLSNKNNNTKFKVKYDELPNKAQSEAKRLIEEFGIDGADPKLIATCFIHSSYAFERPNKKFINYKPFIKLGSLLIDLNIDKSILDNVLTKPNQICTSNNNADFKRYIQNEIIELADRFDFKRSIFVGKGLEKAGITESIKVDAIKAIIGVICFSGCNDQIDFLSKWIQSKIPASLFENESHIGVDPKSHLQSILQVIDELSWRYESNQFGAAHSSSYTSDIYFQSQITKKQFCYRSEVKRSKKKQSEQDIAEATIRVLAILNGMNKNINYKLCKLFEGYPSLSSFLLEHTINAIPIDYEKCRKWASVGMIGCDLLRGKRFRDFRLWLDDLTKFLTKQPDGTVTELKFYDFYKTIGLQHKNLRLQDNFNYSQNLATIYNHLKNIDVMNYKDDIKSDPLFANILVLSQLSKLKSNPYKLSSIKDTIESFILLKHGRKPTIKFDCNIREGDVFYETEGTFQLLLETIWEIFAKMVPDKEVVSLNVFTPSHDREICIEFINDNIASESFKSEINNNEIISYILSNANGINYLFGEKSITVILESISNFESNNFSSQCLEKYLSSNNNFQNEDYSVSRILHDLKNQLLAFQVCINKPSDTATTALRNRLSASEHLDNAINLCQSAQILSRSLVVPEIEELDFNMFIKDFIAKKITTLPDGIRISTPSSNERCIIYSSKEFLGSIFENIFKNSIEAIHNDGQISIDYLYDHDDKQLLIEIADNGSGIPEEILNSIQNRQFIKSIKENGSGVGMLTVNAMLDRIGGSYSLESEVNKGTKWSITLNDLKEVDTTFTKLDDGNFASDMHIADFVENY